LVIDDNDKFKNLCIILTTLETIYHG